MIHSRQKMLDEIKRRNYSQNTVCTYLHAAEDFYRYFHRSCFGCRKPESKQRSILTSFSLLEVSS